MIRFAVSRPLAFLAVLTYLTLLGSTSSGQDPMPKEASTTEASPANSPPAAEQLTKIVESMRAIETRLKDRETGEETQTAQQDIVDLLDKLLNMPPETPPPSNGGGGANNNPPPPNKGGGNSPSQGQQSQQSKSKNSPQSDPSQMRPKPAGQQKSKDRQTAKDSEERTGPNRAATTPAAKRQRLEVDVWGHLPEKLREQLLNSYGERMLPQYEEAVRRFYDQLADPAAARPRR